MDGLIGSLSEFGVLGIISGLSILANVYLFTQIQKMHKENRDNDRDMLKQLFDALGLINAIRLDRKRQE